MINSSTFNQELKQSFTFQNREILDNYVILAVTDVEGIINHVSTHLCNTFKYKPSELIGKPYSFLIEKTNIENFNNEFNETKAIKNTWKGELKHINKHDGIIWTDTIMAPLYNENKELIGFIFTNIDITKEKTLKKLNEENLLKNNYDKSTLNFLPSLSSAVLLKTSSGLQKILWLITVTIMFLLIWSYFFEIDDIVKSEGKIVTNSNIQNISSYENSNLKEIYVKEGDKVKKGDTLFKLSDLSFTSEYEKKQYLKYNLLAKIARLEAQSFDKTIIENKEVVDFDYSIMKNEIELFDTNKKKITFEVNILEEQLKQKKNDLNEAERNLSINEQNYELLKKEKAIKEPLAKEKVISKIDLLDLLRKENDLLIEIKKLKSSIISINSSIKEIGNNIQKTTENYHSESKNELIVAKKELEDSQKDISYLNEKIKETIIKSPHDGVMNKIYVKTINEAITTGKTIAEIIPSTDYFLAEIKVKPSDIGFLYLGQKVRLKLRPYDFTLYGAIDAEISYISADTIPNPQKESEEFYVVQIKLNKGHLNSNEKLIIKPGMTVDADIITGKKSILRYVLKPILKSIDI